MKSESRGGGEGGRERERERTPDCSGDGPTDMSTMSHTVRAT